MNASTHKTKVLLVEDNPADAWLVKDLIFRQTPHVQLIHLNDGDKAEHYLLQEVKAGRQPAPDVVLLDLNLPHKSGQELLQEIRSDGTLHGIPVFVLTSSANPSDVENCKSLGANLFITKPAGLPEFVELIRRLVDYEIPRALNIGRA